jgi:uncharacterized protein (DUF4415 family)
MSLPEMINGLAAAMAEAKEQLTAVREKISAAKSEVNRIKWAAPHTDDIVDAFKRGVAHADQNFEQRLRLSLNGLAMHEHDAAVTIANGKPSLLMLDRKAKSAPAGGNPVEHPLPWSGIGDNQREIDVAAVTYFLRDIIAAELPALIEKVCPASKSGMKQEDRAAALRQAEDALRQLEAEEKQWVDQINAALMAVQPPRP